MPGCTARPPGSRLHVEYVTRCRLSDHLVEPSKCVAGTGRTQTPHERLMNGSSRCARACRFGSAYNPGTLPAAADATPPRDCSGIRRRGASPSIASAHLRTHPPPPDQPPINPLLLHQISDLISVRLYLTVESIRPLPHALVNVWCACVSEWNACPSACARVRA